MPKIFFDPSIRIPEPNHPHLDRMYLNLAKNATNQDIDASPLEITTDFLVVDLACGCGHETNRLSKQLPMKVWGIDTDPNSIDAAKRLYGYNPNLEFMIGDTCFQSWLKT